MKQSRKKKAIVAYIGKLLLGIIFVSPLFVGLLFSLVPNEQLYIIPSIQTLTRDLTLQNYSWVFTNVPILRFLLNTVVVCVMSIGVQILSACFAGYALTYFNFRGSKFLWNLILIAMMIPGQVTIVANYLLVQQLRLSNTFIGLSITSFVSGTSIFMLRQSLKQIPYEMRQAAAIDGCGHMKYLFTILMPMLVPTIASLAIYLFIGIYNHYLWPMLVATRTEMQTVQIGMAMLVGEETTEYGHVLAGAVVSVVVPIIIFILGQEYIINGMTSGAVKG